MKNEMSQRATEAKRAYNRKWRQSNPDKIRKYQADYWERKAAKDETDSEATIKDKARTLHEQGYSLREIGSRLNVSHMTVKRLLQDCNNPLHPGNNADEI